MYKECEKCKKQYGEAEKKCPICGHKLKKKLTEEELKEIEKQNEEMMLINMFMM